MNKLTSNNIINKSLMFIDNKYYIDIDLKLLNFIKYDINIDVTDLEYINNNKYNFSLDDLNNRYKIIKNYRKKLYELKKLPYIQQRSIEWFELRKTCLTASDLFDGISKNNLNLAKKKAGVLINDIDFVNIPALKWGIMFEDMASRCYSQRYNNIDIYDFGLITNNNIKNFGASPDGINDIGIMLEIKCPYSRKIVENFIPEKYYYQIQGQLAICELNECDYIECIFEIIHSENEYIEYIIKNNLTTTDHGIIAEYYNLIEKNYYYIYSEPNLLYNDVLIDINNKINNQKNNNLKFIKLNRWVLKNINIQRILFDENLWNSIIPKINFFWNKVIECKNLPIEYKTTTNNKFKFINDD